MELSNYNLNKIEDCVHFMVDSDEPHARARANVDAIELRIKTTKAMEFIKAEAKTATEREAMALVAIEHGGLAKEYEEAVYLHELLKAKRGTAQIQIDLYRTKSANKRGALI
jgi:hypothetical protein